MTHSVDEVADSLSTGELDLPGPATRIIAPSGKEVPFARKGADIHLLALETGMYRIVSPGGETNIAVNPPALPAQRVKLTPAEAAGVEGEPLPAHVAGICGAGWSCWPSWRSGWNGGFITRPGSGSARRKPGKRPASQPLAGDSDRELEEREESAVRNPNLVGR